MPVSVHHVLACLWCEAMLEARQAWPLPTTTADSGGATQVPFPPLSPDPTVSDTDTPWILSGPCHPLQSALTIFFNLHITL